MGVEVMEFDRNYLDQEIFRQRRLQRDVRLSDLGVDPEAFHVWQRQQEVDNEAGTDEYRETQPSKGLAMISDFLADWAPGGYACDEMLRLVKKWLDAYYAPYGGTDELAAILTICFDFMWEQGGFSLFTSIDQLPDEGTVEYYKEDRGTN